MILIGLHGRRGSGKDTAFSFMQDWAEGRGLSAVRRGFADKLKQSAALALGFQVSPDDAIVLMDELKAFGEITTCIPNQSVLYTIEGRKFLQLYGTEAHRDVFGEDFWIDALLPVKGHVVPEQTLGVKTWEDNFTFRNEAGWPESADFAVVTDVRFENEAQRIKDLGGVVWEIRRGGLPEDVHSSEMPIRPELIDKVIHNDGSLEDLSREIHSEMTIDYHMRFVPQPEEPCD